MSRVAAEWGTVGEWVGGLAASLGLVFAAWEIRASTRERHAAEARRVADEEERREAMARSVSVRADLGVEPTTDLPGPPTGGPCAYRMSYRLHNGGEFPIDDVVLVVADPGADAPSLQDQKGTALELVVGTVASGDTEEGEELVTLTERPAFEELTSLAGVLFTDTWGTHWFRAPGVLERRNSAPRIC